MGRFKRVLACIRANKKAGARRGNRPLMPAKQEEAGLEAFAFQTLPFHFACATYGFSRFTRFALGRLFKVPTQFHFTEDAFALHFFLERFKSLIDIVVTD